MNAPSEPSSGVPAAGADPDGTGRGPLITRRRVLAGGALTAAGAVAGAAVVRRSERVSIPYRVRRLWEGGGPTGDVPDAPAGDVTYERRRSDARGREVGFFTAVPAGHGDGAGLPVCLVLHGASARADDFDGFGLPRFLTAAVENGVPPFVLVGADGGSNRWQAVGGDDPQRMLRDEVPTWCAERGWDTSRIAAHGWSMGGYGSLLLAALNPGWLDGVAVLSPALGGGQLAAHTDRLEGDRVAIWCGTEDAAYDAASEFAARIPGGAAVAEFVPGRHTRGFWNTVTGPALAFVGGAVADSG